MQFSCCFALEVAVLFTLLCCSTSGLVDCHRLECSVADMATETTPLLRQQQQQQQRSPPSSSLQDGHGSTGKSKADATPSSSRTTPTPSAPHRVFSALHAGRLPDNEQLYKLLHAAAAFIDTISKAAVPADAPPPPPPPPQPLQHQASSSSASASTSTGTSRRGEAGADAVLTLAALLGETAALARLTASWLYGGSSSSRSKDDTSGGDEEGPAVRRHSAPRGNENEQLQRLIWHMGQALADEPSDRIVQVEARGELEGGARGAVDAMQSAAVEVRDDAANGIVAMARIAAAIVGSDECVQRQEGGRETDHAMSRAPPPPWQECTVNADHSPLLSFILPSSHRLLRVPSDIVRSLSARGAEAADEASKRAGKVEDVLRKESDKEEQDGFVYPQQALREGFETATNAVDAAVNEANKIGTIDADDKDAEHAAETWDDEIARRLARLVDELGQDEVCARAVDRSIALVHKYMSVADEAKHDIQATVDNAKEVVEDLSAPEVNANTLDGTEKSKATHDEEARIGAAATLSSEHLQAEVSARFSHSAVEAGKAAREMLEGLADGHSLADVMERVHHLHHMALRDSNLRQWVEDGLSLIQRYVKEAGTAAKQGKNPVAATDERAKQFKALIERLHVILKQRPDVIEAWERLKKELIDFVHAVRTNVATRKMRAHARHISSMVRDTFIFGAREARAQTTNVLSTLLHAMLPSLSEILGYIPLPRVEFTSDNLDATMEDINVSALQLLPETLQFKTTNDWQWDRTADALAAQAWHVDTNARLAIGGLRLALSDISFYVQERFTAPSVNACFSCCSFGESSSRWCCLRGPSSWLAYTERAILDVGFSKSGIDIALDLCDAGKDADDWQQELARQRKRGSQRRGKDALQQARGRYAMGDDDDDSDAGSDADDGSAHSSRRATFFDIKDCHVNLSDSFDFRLRSSRHWLINGILRYTTRPLIRLLLRRVIAAQVRHVFTLADTWAWDVHSRAKRAHRWQQRSDEGLPGWKDYFKVLVNSTAGKSQARLEREQRLKEEAEREKRRREQEAEEEEAEAEAEARATTDQPRVSKSMQVKPTGLVMHDADGSYSIAVGLSASPGLVLKDLALEQHGPATKRTRVREAATHPRETLTAVQQHGEALHTAAVEALQAAGDAAAPDHASASRQSSEAVSTARDGASQNTKAPTTTMNSTSEQVHDSDKTDWGWKSSAFDI